MCNNFNNCDLILPRGIVPDAENKITVNFNGNQISICANSDYAKREWIDKVALNYLGHYSNIANNLHNEAPHHLFRFDCNGDLIHYKSGTRWYKFRNIRICEVIDDFNNANLGASLTGIYYSFVDHRWINLAIYTNTNFNNISPYSIIKQGEITIPNPKDIEPDYNVWGNRFIDFRKCEFRYNY